MNDIVFIVLFAFAVIVSCFCLYAIYLESKKLDKNLKQIKKTKMKLELHFDYEKMLRRIAHSYNFVDFDSLTKDKPLVLETKFFKIVASTRKQFDDEVMRLGFLYSAYDEVIEEFGVLIPATKKEEE